MAYRTYPTVMVNASGQTVTVRTAREYWNHYWTGWRPTDTPVPVDPNDGFNDAAVAALILNMDSETFAALASMVITKLELQISQNAPTAPAPGTVWIKNQT